jgi:hypothetical protein
VLCALVLGASLCLATYGLDLSAGFLTVLPRGFANQLNLQKAEQAVGNVGVPRDEPSD